MTSKHQKWTRTALPAVGSAAVVVAVGLGSQPDPGGPPTANATPCDTTAAAWTPAIWMAAQVPQVPPMAQGQGTPQGDSGNADPVAQWGSRVQGPFRDFQNSVQSMTNAIHAQDINALKTACGQLGSAGHEPGAMLPSLSNAVTAEVNAAVSDIGTSLNNSCTAAGPDTTNSTR